MTISDHEEIFVWIWLPGETDPVVAGVLAWRGATAEFTYGRSYRENPSAIPIFSPELDVSDREIPPRVGDLHGAIRDAGPDSWGRRVIEYRLLGRPADAEAGPSDMVMLIESGSDRIGALDFQTSPSEYVPRHEDHATLEELMQAAALLERGENLTPALERALLHGTAVGGARPKALIVGDDGRSRIAKFSSSTDDYPVVRGEFVAMELARRVSLDVATVELAHVRGKDVLLVDRFDRPGDGTRRAVVSAMTILEMDPRAWTGSYAALAHIMRQRFRHAKRDVHELFGRIVFNILVGNDDDHARNHAAFWDGRTLDLTPAYDICPGPRGGGETRQLMEIGDDGYRESKLIGCVERAGTYLLTEAEARAVVDRQISVIESEWDDVCEMAGLGPAERRRFWHRQFLNPSVLYGY